MAHDHKRPVPLPLRADGPREIDPVCGMTVVPPTAAGHWEHEGRTYHFCASSCREKFKAEPVSVPEVSRPRDARGDLTDDACAGGARGWRPHLPDASRGPAGGPRRVSELRDGPGAAGDRGPGLAHRVRLPHAPRDRPPRAGELPDLRHGPRAAHGHARRTREPRARRHAPPLLGRPGPDRAGVPPGDGDMLPGKPLAHLLSPATQAWVELAAGHARSCSGRAGRSSSAAGRRSSNRSPNMFTLIGIGTGAAFALQRGGDALPAP